MKLTIAREQLLSVLRVMARAVKDEAGAPMRGMVALRTDATALRVWGADSHLALAATIATDPVYKDGMLVCGLRSLLHAIDKSGELVTLTEHKSGLVITSAGRKFVLQLALAEDFAEHPVVSSAESLVWIRLASEVLKQLFARVGYAMPRDTNRATINGIWLHPDGGVAAFATNGHMSAYAVVSGEIAAPVFVPAELVDVLGRVVVEDEVSIVQSSKRIHVRFGIWSLLHARTEVLSDAPPPWKSMIEKTASTITVDRLLFLKALGAMASGDDGATMRGIPGSQMQLVSRDLGNLHRADAPAQITAPFEVVMSVKYLEQAASAATADAVTLKVMTSRFQAVLLEDGTGIALLMPLNLDVDTTEGLLAADGTPLTPAPPAAKPRKTAAKKGASDATPST